MRYTVEELERMVELVNEYNSSLYVFRCIPMEDIGEYLEGIDAEQVLKMAHFGEFSIMDDYFYVDNQNNNLFSFNEENKKELFKNGEDEIFHTYYDLAYEGKIKDEFDLI